MPQSSHKLCVPNITHCVQVWNNIGLCFFGKERYIAAIACLKRALYLGPFEWIVCYNLGLAHINTYQYATAFNHLSAAINLKPSFANTYMWLGVTLANLGDLDNACNAYERAIEKDPGDPLFRLNYGAGAALGGFLGLFTAFCCSAAVSTRKQKASSLTCVLVKTHSVTCWDMQRAHSAMVA